MLRVGERIVYLDQSSFTGGLRDPTTSHGHLAFPSAADAAAAPQPHIELFVHRLTLCRKGIILHRGYGTGTEKGAGRFEPRTGRQVVALTVREVHGHRPLRDIFPGLWSRDVAPAFGGSDGGCRQTRISAVTPAFGPRPAGPHGMRELKASVLPDGGSELS